MRLTSCIQVDKDRNRSRAKLVIPLPRLLTALWVSVAIMAIAALIAAWKCGQYRDAYERLYQTQIVLPAQTK